MSLCPAVPSRSFLSTKLHLCVPAMLQMIRRAKDPAELRQLLAEQGLADGIAAAFDNEQLQFLLDKGLATPAMLALADMAGLEKATYSPSLLGQSTGGQVQPSYPHSWPRCVAESWSRLISGLPNVATQG